MNNRLIWGGVCLIALALICLAPMLVSQQAQSRAAEPGASLYRLLAINVGKADSLILQAEGKNYLIDTGTVQSYGAVETALQSLGITQLDGVFLTHTHKDHAGGMERLAQSAIRVDAWYAPKYSVIDKEKKHPAYLAAESRRMTVQWLSAGDKIPVSEHSSLTVIGPKSLDEKEENNNSLVMVFTSPDGNILLAGDMERAEEQELMSQGAVPACQVLKVAHHGEDDTTSPAFVKAVAPKAAVISTNSIEEPDTPAGTVLLALKNAGAQVAVTQNAKGGVLCSLNQGQVSVEAVSFLSVPEACDPLRLTSLDTQNEILTIQNNGKAAVSMAGWYVFSSRGNEVFLFPKDAVIEPGAALTLGTLDTQAACNFVWQETNVWHNKKQDQAVLYDRWGRAVSRISNGIAP